MDENNELEILQHEPVPNKAILQKWLPILLYVQCTSMAISVLSLIIPLGNVTTWIGYFVTIAVFSVLYRLGPACGRYRKSAVFQCVSLILMILNAVVIINSGAATGTSLLGSVFTFAASVCTLIASYQEYYSDGEVIRELDGKLAKRWRSLFVWQIVVGVVVGLGSSIIAVLSVMIGFAEVATVGILVLITGLAGVALRIVYLLYLGKMIKLLKG